MTIKIVPVAPSVARNEIIDNGDDGSIKVRMTAAPFDHTADIAMQHALAKALA